MKNGNYFDWMVGEISIDSLEPQKPSQRHNQGKLPMHLVPADTIEALAAVLQKGMEKYDERNWERGNFYSVPYASLMRHLLAWWQGEDNDPESGLSHTVHILMNAAMLVRYSEQFPNYDDRPKKGKLNEKTSA